MEHYFFSPMSIYSLLGGCLSLWYVIYTIREEDVPGASRIGKPAPARDSWRSRVSSWHNVSRRNLQFLGLRRPAEHPPLNLPQQHCNHPLHSRQAPHSDRKHGLHRFCLRDWPDPYVHSLAVPLGASAGGMSNSTDSCAQCSTTGSGLAVISSGMSIAVDTLRDSLPLLPTCFS